MGTRHLTIVKKNGEIKVAQYGQWDGYPEYTGARILKFCREHLTFESGRKYFEDKVSGCRFLSEEEVERINNLIDNDPALREYDDQFRPAWTKRWPELSRDEGYHVLEMIICSRNGLELVNQMEFIHDHVFCEWAWLIDLDEDTFGDVIGEEPGSYRYAHKWSLHDLPTDEEFLEAYKEEDE